MIVWRLSTREKIGDKLAATGWNFRYFDGDPLAGPAAALA
jgi:hypothetical protein